MKGFDWRLVQQMALGLDIEEEQDEGSAIPGPDERHKIDEAARVVFEQAAQQHAQYVPGSHTIHGGSAQPAPPGWMDEYWRLRESGWPWRVAAYIAWSASPRDRRWPERQIDLAQQVLGLKSDRVITQWRKKNPMIDEVIALMQARPLFEHRRDIFDALVAVATQQDYKGHQDRKLALEMLGDYVPRSELRASVGTRSKDLSELTDAELAALAGEVLDIQKSGEDGEEGI